MEYGWFTMLCLYQVYSKQPFTLTVYQALSYKEHRISQIMLSNERYVTRISVVKTKISATYPDLIRNAEMVVELGPHRDGNGRSSQAKENTLVPEVYEQSLWCFRYFLLRILLLVFSDDASLIVTSLFKLPRVRTWLAKLITLILVTEGQGQLCGHMTCAQGVPMLGLMLCYSKLTILCLNLYFEVKRNGTVAHICEQRRHTQYVSPFTHCICDAPRAQNSHGTVTHGGHLAASTTEQGEGAPGDPQRPYFPFDLELVLPNTSSCAQCTVRPNTPKHLSLEQRKVCCRAMQGDSWLVPPKLRTPQSGSAKHF